MRWDHPSQGAVRPRVGRSGLGAAAICVFLTACGDGTATQAEGAGHAEVSGPALTCPSDMAEVVALLRSGLPTYDYDPAVDLADLVSTRRELSTRPELSTDDFAKLGATIHKLPEVRISRPFSVVAARLTYTHNSNKITKV